jgi:hypothetical protein
MGLQPEPLIVMSRSRVPDHILDFADLKILARNVEIAMASLVAPLWQLETVLRTRAR